MTTQRRADRRWAAPGGIAVLTALLAACGGGTPSDGPPSRPTGAVAESTSAAPTSAGSTTRPEGPWTIVAWTVERSDAAAEQRLGRGILASFEPACSSGPCDLTLSPAGSDGTFRESEAPPAEGDTPSVEPVTLSWDGAAYVGTTPERELSCTPVQGTVVPGGYLSTSTWSLTFVPPTADAGARAHGTIVEEVTGTDASRPQGCTDFTETRAFGAAPTGTIDAQTAPAGRYDASLSSTTSTPKSLAPVGRALWLGPMSAAGAAGAPTVTGLTGAEGALTQEPAGWGTTTPTAPSDCTGADGAVTTGGADGQETFAALRPVAITEDGSPIFAGTWTLRANPNATGLAAGCSLAIYEGRLYLVPEGAGG